MSYTPVELRHVRVGRRLFGYARDEVDTLLEEVADSFEQVWSERGELADRLEDLEKLLADVKQREQLLASTLVAAEKAAVEAKEAAKREAELIVAEAHHEARSITRAAQTERERLFAEARRVETLLRAALGMVEESQAGARTSEGEQASEEHPPAPPPVGPLRERWPAREDTREFDALTAEPPPPAPEPPSDPPPAAQHEVRLPPVTLLPDADDDGPAAARDFAWG